MARDLLTIRCPEDIKTAIEDRMATTGKGKTDVVLELLRTALGMPSTATEGISITALDERLDTLVDERLHNCMTSLDARITITLDERTTLLDERMTIVVDERTTVLNEQVTAQVNEALVPVGEALVAMDDALGK